ncbi:MAG: uncharacterized protein JWP91_3691 [Fibrobacteres bacterium]|nr:uncharacterized protein [Fibrobacterota bacterium]
MPEEGRLALGVIAGFFADVRDGSIKGHAPFGHVGHFRIAQGGEGGEGPPSGILHKPPRLLQPASARHGLHPRIDTTIQIRAIRVQPKDGRALEARIQDRRPGEAGIAPPREQQVFPSLGDAIGIVGMDALRAFRILPDQFGMHAGEPLGANALLDLELDGLRSGTPIERGREQEFFEVEARAPHHQEAPVRAGLEEAMDMGREFAGREGIGGIDESRKMVGNLGLFGRGRGSGAHFQAPVDLAGVGGDDLEAIGLGELEGQGGFTRGGGAAQDGCEHAIMIAQEGEFAILPGPAMGVVRKILIFVVLTAGIILLGKVAPKVFGFLPKRAHAPAATNTDITPDSLRDSTNALPEVEADTTGGRWHEKLFEPLERAYGLTAKNIKQKKGFWEVVFPKGKPIHEYALQIENICRANAIAVEQGVELRPANRSVEYLLQSNGQRIKLRASLGNAFMAGSARLAIVFTDLDSLRETQLAALESAQWDKTLVVDAYCANPVIKKLRYTRPRNELLLELPMEPAAYPFVDPGKHALFIHHSKEDVEKILTEGLDSVPHAAGYASRLGDRAIENQPLLEKLFQFTARKGMVFLDLTGSPRSLARQTAAAQGARSRTVASFKDSLRVEEELARKCALAQKTGDAILVLPYTASAFRILEKSLDANAIRFNEMGLELVTLSSLVAAPDSVSTAPVVKSIPEPSAKPVAATKGKPAGANPAAQNAPKAPAARSAPAKPPAKPVAKPVPAKPAVKPAAPMAKSASPKPAAKPKAKAPAAGSKVKSDSARAKSGTR